ELDPSLVVAVYAAREIYRNAGNFKAAAVLYDLEANAEPDPKRKVALYRELAHLRSERLGDLEGAVVALKRALSLSPGDLSVMHELSSVLLRRAEQSGHDAGTTDRKRAADLLYQMAQNVPSEHAIAYLEAALDVVPDHDGALSLLEQHADALQQTERLPARWVAFLQSAPDAPGSLEMRRRLGYAYISADQVEDAIVCFEPLRDAGDPDAAGLLVDLYRRVGRTDELARTLAVQLAGLAPNERVPRLRELAQILLAEGKREEAQQRMNEILMLDPADPEALAFLEDDYRGRGDYGALRDLLLAAVRVPGVSAESRKLRLREVAGIAESRLGDLDGAIAAWRALNAMDPGDAEVRTQLRRLLEQGQRWDDLVKLLEREALSVADYETKADLYRTLAHLHRHQRGDLREAVIALRKLRELAPGDRQARNDLGDVLEALGEHVEAMPLLRERAAETPPGAERASILKRLARVFEEELQNDEEAFAACARVLDDEPDDFESLARMERIDERLERWERLLETLGYRVEVTADPTSKARLHARMAEVADRNLGDADRAIEHLTKAHELLAGDPEILNGLSELYERLGRYEDLIVLLSARGKVESDPRARAEIYRRVARVLSVRLHNAQAAAEAWIEVLRAGEDAEALEALAGHAEAEGDDETLVDALDRLAALSQESETRRNLLTKRAEVLSSRLGRPQEAIEVLRLVATQIDREHTPAMALLASLCEQEGDVVGQADALEMQLAATHDPGLRVPLAERLAEIYETKLDEPARAAAALEAWAEADPTDGDVVARLVPLYERLGKWSRLVEALDALAGLVGDEHEASALWLRAVSVQEQKVGDIDGAWARLAERVSAGDAKCEDELRHLAERARRNDQLAALYVRLAQAAAESGDADEQRRRWRDASDVYDKRLGDPGKALEALLRAFATDLGDESYLDEIDRLGSAAGAFQRLGQVYEALVRQADTNERKTRMLLRHADVLAHGAGDPSAAFDEVLRAAALSPNDRELLAKAEALAAASGRGEDLLVVYDRRRAASESNLDRIDSLARAARVSDLALGDRDRAFMYVQQAINLLAREPTGADRIEEVVADMDRHRPVGDPEAARRLLVATYREVAEAQIDEPELAGMLTCRAARILLDELDDVETAFAALKEASASAPGETVILDTLERIAERTGWWVAVADQYASLVEEALDQQLAVLLLRRRGRIVLEILDKPSDAAAIYEQLLVVNPHDTDAAARLRHCLTRAGRHQDYLAALERGLEMTFDPSERAELMREIARTWEGPLRNRYEALDAWRRVLAEHPGDPEATQAVARFGSASRSVAVDEDDDLLEEIEESASTELGEVSSAEDVALGDVEVHDDAASLDAGTFDQPYFTGGPQPASAQWDQASDEGDDTGRRGIAYGGDVAAELGFGGGADAFAEPRVEEQANGAAGRETADDGPADDAGLPDFDDELDPPARVIARAPRQGAGPAPRARRDDVIHIDDDEDEDAGGDPDGPSEPMDAPAFRVEGQPAAGGRASPRGLDSAEETMSVPRANDALSAALRAQIGGGLDAGELTYEVGIPGRQEEDTASLLALAAAAPLPEVRTGVLPPDKRPDAIRPEDEYASGAWGRDLARGRGASVPVDVAPLRVPGGHADVVDVDDLDEQEVEDVVDDEIEEVDEEVDEAPSGQPSRPPPPPGGRR
ncbi:MAG: hypothetical protein IT379_18970, partial [Deltaproteobacteria bacterium]|nr:hypothetical protein [Deltaproteobacteria bacterium]